MPNVNEIAAYLLTKQDTQAGDAITHLKLQKLAYYAEAWHLAVFDGPLTDEPFEAWVHGPVSRRLYDKYGGYKWSAIQSPSETEYAELSGTQREFLDEVWEVYGGFSAKHLENLTHKEAPWREARNGLSPIERSQTPISSETMKRYYGSLLESDVEE